MRERERESIWDVCFVIERSQKVRDLVPPADRSSYDHMHRQDQLNTDRAESLTIIEL